MSKHFLKWWKKEQRKFHCGQFNDEQVAYSAWLAGADHKKLTNNDSIDTNNLNKAKQFLETIADLIFEIENSELTPYKKIHILEEISNKALATKQFVFLKSTQPLEDNETAPETWDDIMDWRY